MAKKPRPPGKKYNFMDTYGDLVTLLMCFFVLLFAMSTVEETKYNAFVEALTTQFGPAPTNMSFVVEEPDETATDFNEQDPTGDMVPADETLPADLAQLEEALQEYIAENDLQGEITTEKSASGATFIRLSDNLLFDGNSAELRPEVLGFLDFFGESLNAIEGQIMQVKLNAHTASIAQSDVDDWVLAGERAGRVASYLNNMGGFSRFKIAPVIHGRNYPIADNSTPEGRAQNRRVDIIVLGNDSSNLAATLADAMRIYFPGDDTQYFEGSPEDIPGYDLEGLTPGEGAAIMAAMDDDELNQLLEDMEHNGETPQSTGGEPPEQNAPEDSND